jgi:uridine monophosphate synthetase
MTYRDRAKECENPAARSLFESMIAKQTNLALANDEPNIDRFLSLVEELGEEVAVVKTHLDALSYPSLDDIWPLIRELQALSKKHGFMVFEDAKFEETGHIVKKKYTQGPFRIAEWAHFVSAHASPGPGVIEGIYEGAKPFIRRGEKRGLIMVAQMTSEGNLFTPETTEATIRMSEQYPEFVAGFIGTGSQPEKLMDELAARADPRFLIATPGLQFDETEGELRQRYGDPAKAVLSGSDLMIVGGGIYKARSPVNVAREYRRAGWDAYMKRPHV